MASVATGWDHITTGANLDRCSITSFGRSITTANFDRNTASRSSHTPGSTVTDHSTTSHCSFGYSSSLLSC